MSSQEIKEHVKKRYSERAIRSQTECGCSSSCCGPSRDSWAEKVGYTLQELDTLPDQALSAAAGCGNPTALASLQEGEVVLDLGSGGGIDVILASKKIGVSGKAIGVDMTDEMIELSRRNALEAGAANTEFRKGDIEDLPVEDESVDVVISNCVINLAPNKDKVFSEVYRVLKPGGRFLVSDIVTEGDLPEEVKNNLDKWAECIGGAIDGSEYIEKLRNAGFKEVKEISRRGYLGIFSAEIQGYKPHIQIQECC